jgi:hypothetical protein
MARLSRRYGLMAEEVAEGLGKMIRAAWENGISREAAGVKNGVDDVADELIPVAAFETHGHGDGGFDRLRVGDFEQDDITLMVQERFEFGVSRRELDVEALLLKGAMEMLCAAHAIAREKDGRNEKRIIIRFGLFGLHGLLAPFLWAECGEEVVLGRSSSNRNPKKRAGRQPKYRNRLSDWYGGY